MCKAKSIWSSNTINDNVDFMYFGRDGQIVLYGKDHTKIWTVPDYKYLISIPEKLILQDDGNIVLYDKDGTSKWSSETSGICYQG